MIWCVEDDASIRDIEVYALQSTGFEAKGFEDGTSFWEALRTGRPELVVLDVMLPGIDGMELLRRMRADAALSDIPVVMATAKGAEYDKIRGLDLGADYYLTKPFGVMELVSCVKAVLRRCGTKSASQFRCGGLVLDEESHTVTADGERRADIQGIRTAAPVPLASRHGVFARPAHGGRVGHGLLRRDAHGGHAHPHAAAEARRVRREDRDRARRGLPDGGQGMTKKIFHSILLVAGAVLLASLLVIMGCLYEYFGSVEKKQLRDELELAAVAVKENGTEYLSQLSSERYRLTWIENDGTVLYDTVTDAESLENHADRVEVKQALEYGEGESTRYSSTLLQKTMYCAERLADGSVLRISMSRATAGVLLVGMGQPILVVLIVALILSSVLAKSLSHRIVQPLNKLDLEHPLENDAYEELAPLLGRINRQHLQIDEQMDELQRQQTEFSQITSSMREGLVLLDEKEHVLSINPAAEKLFGTDESCVGQDFLTIDRSHDMSLAIERAMDEGHSEARVERGGRIWQFDVSRIGASGAAVGAVLLAFDITERETAEQTRREFTANVSHELKTPLQGIIGSAELLENGMVKQEDVPRFVGHIRKEAQRLVTLIGDIIRLSQLDEGDEMPRETVDLLTLSQEAADDLKTAAAEKHIAIAVEGRSETIGGVRRLLYEVIYNLCDNAIKYNVEGGSVTMSVGERDGKVFVSVADTGIGIAPEHQSRIFERFYRVDKSHSKASGGTGLGLSIVKHAVQYHHGTVELHSEEGKGTTICILLPKE